MGRKKAYFASYCNPNDFFFYLKNQVTAAEHTYLTLLQKSSCSYLKKLDVMLSNNELKEILYICSSM